jgi:nitrate/TMAO reductase-like tetraheme cytochrome c subunit
MTKQAHPLSWIVGSTLTVLALAIGAVGLSLTFTSTGYADDGRELNQAIPQNAEYSAECGSCHMAYPANLLPAEKWQAITSNLSSHFGDDASMAPEAAARIEQYLVQHAAQNGKVMKNSKPLIDGMGPQKITEQAFFIRKHDEIPRRMVQDNPKVGSFSQCSNCHNLAEKGIFDEDTVNIPGFGRWDD